MKKVFRYLFSTLIVAVVSSCFGSYDTYRSFVTEYYTLNEIYAGAANSDGSIRISSGLPDGWRHLGSWNSKGEAKEAYDEACRRHGDMSYNERVHTGVKHVYRSLADDFQRIDIVSDAAFDASHPAGASLSDVMLFRSATPLPYIRSGYKKMYVTETGRERPEHPIEKTVSELTPEDLVLLHGYGSLGGEHICDLIFVSQPTLEKDHNITVTFTRIDGEEFSATVEYVFE